jgi:two-component system, NarL family, sensor kinase
VEDLFENLNETEGLLAEVKIEGEPTRLSGNKEIMLYRIVQEMVNNTLKHAEAKNIKLNMEIQPNNLKIDYWDNGKGFNLVEKLESKSIGLTSIQSRVKFINGEIEVNSKPGEGVTYDISVPLP